MRKFITAGLVLLAGGVLMSCQSQGSKEPMFGTIPSIYENEMLKLTVDTKKKTKGMNELLNVMFEKTDSVYKVANLNSLKETNRLVGVKIGYVVDDDVNISVKSDITIKDVYLPDLYADEGSGALTDYVSFDVKSDDALLYYTLDGDTCSISYGTIGAAQKDDSGVSHINIRIPSPNVPAKYQEACNTIHFVSYQTYLKQQNHIDSLQQVWRKAYSKKLGI